MQGKADRSGWDDFHAHISHDALRSRTPAPISPTTRAAAPSSRGWYHVRWIVLIVLLVGATGYAVSEYLAAKAGQTTNAAKWFATRHTIDALQRQQKVDHMGVGPGNARPQQGANQTRGQAAPAIAARSNDTGPATRDALERIDAAGKAGTLKCIAGVPYEVATRDGVTSYTNLPGATCNNRQRATAGNGT